MEGGGGGGMLGGYMFENVSSFFLKSGSWKHSYVSMILFLEKPSHYVLGFFVDYCVSSQEYSIVRRLSL